MTFPNTPDSRNGELTADNQLTRPGGILFELYFPKQNAN